MAGTQKSKGHITPQELARRKAQSARDKQRNRDKQGPRPPRAPKQRARPQQPRKLVAVPVSSVVPGAQRLVAAAPSGKFKSHVAALILPAEFPACRLVTGMGVRTVLTALSTAFTLTVPPQSSAATDPKSLRGTSVYGCDLDGFTVILSKQPSRMIGQPLKADTVDHAFYYGTSTPDTAGKTRPLPTNHIAHPQFYNSGNFGSTETSPEDFAPLDVTPMAWSQSAAAFDPHDHVAMAAGDYYVWADKHTLDDGTVETDLLALKLTLNVKAATSINVTVTAKLLIYQYTGDGLRARNPLLVADYSASRVLPAGADYASVTLIDGGFTIPTSGYFRFVVSNLRITGVPSSTPVFFSYQAPVGYQSALNATMIRTRKKYSMEWLAAPEFYNSGTASPLFEDVRCTALGVLISNRTPPLNKAGYFYSRLVESEDNFYRLLQNNNTGDSFRAACSVQPGVMGYEGDVATGMYYWAKFSPSDKTLRSYVSPIGSALYYLELDTPVAIVNIQGSQYQQDMFVHMCTHMESSVTSVQSFGIPKEPMMTTAEYDHICCLVANWPVFHENPTHVLDLLRRLGAGLWKGFQFSAPYLARAALAAASGSTPIGALAAALTH